MSNVKRAGIAGQGKLEAQSTTYAREGRHSDLTGMSAYHLPVEAFTGLFFM